MSGGEGGADDQVELLGGDARGIEGRPRRLGRQIGCCLAVGGEPPFPMPVRSRIHSSLVSELLELAFGTTRSGRADPTPATRRGAARSSDPSVRATGAAHGRPSRISSVDRGQLRPGTASSPEPVRAPGQRARRRTPRQSSGDADRHGPARPARPASPAWRARRRGRLRRTRRRRPLRAPASSAPSAPGRSRAATSSIAERSGIADEPPGDVGHDREPGLSELAASRAARSGSTAGCISGEWNAPATFSRIARTPRSAACSARSIAGTLPQNDLLRRFSFATARTSPPPAASQISAASVGPTPSSAVIVPGCCSAAVCIARPRMTTASCRREVEDAGGDERGEFAERVPGRCLRTSRRRPPGPCSPRHRTRGEPAARTPSSPGPPRRGSRRPRRARWLPMLPEAPTRRPDARSTRRPCRGTEIPVRGTRPLSPSRRFPRRRSDDPRRPVTLQPQVGGYGTPASRCDRAWRLPASGFLL